METKNEKDIETGKDTAPDGGVELDGSESKIYCL